MLNQAQINWVVKKLLEEGQITRNECLQKYISRLGAIIYMLKKRWLCFCYSIQ